MPLTSLRFMVASIVVAMSIPVALLFLWRKGSRKPGWTLAAILATVLAGQGAAVVAAAVAVNRAYGFYPTWS